MQKHRVSTGSCSGEGRTINDNIYIYIKKNTCMCTGATTNTRTVDNNIKGKKKKKTHIGHARVLAASDRTVN